MSYILDALKRAEQQRGGPARAIRAPRAFPTEAASRARWPWLAGGAAGMAVLVAAIALWPTTAPLPPASTSAPEDVSTIAAKAVTVARPAVGSSDVSRAASAPAAPPAAEPRPSPVIDRRAPARVAPPAARSRRRSCDRRRRRPSARRRRPRWRAPRRRDRAPPGQRRRPATSRRW